MTKQNKAKSRELEAALQSVKSLYVFLRNFWGTINQDEYIDSPHIRELCQELTRYGDAIAKKKKIKDLIINIPPGASKSTIVSQMFPVWLWLRAPWAVVISSSYSHTISVEHSSKAKSIFKSEKYQKWYSSYFKKMFGKELRLTKDTEQDWTNNLTGRRYATSTLGSITGVHGHVIIRDDPMSPKQAQSDALRMAAHKFNDRTLANRKKDLRITPTITVMQRLHKDDTTGYELKKKKDRIYHICLPAQASKAISPDKFKRIYKKGLLDPVRMPKRVLDNMAEDLGSYSYAGQYQQIPSPEGGGKIKYEWFVKCHEKEIPGGIIWDLWIDGAYTEKTKNDPTGLVVAGHHKRLNRCYVLHAVSKHMGMPELLKFIPEYSSLLGLGHRSRVFIEPKASGKSIKQMLNNETHLSAIEIKNHLVQEGKEARLQVASPKIEAGKVWLVDGPWNKDFMDQLCMFPVHDHDEYVDLMGYICEEYFIYQPPTGVGY